MYAPTVDCHSAFLALIAVGCGSLQVHKSQRGLMAGVQNMGQCLGFFGASALGYSVGANYITRSHACASAALLQLRPARMHSPVI